MSEELLRECIRVVIDENFAAATPGAGYGIHIAPGRLYDTFINPWLDVFRTARAETEKLSASAQRFAKTVIEAAISTAIPFVDAEFGKIKAQEKTQMARIDSKYADVYQRVQKGIDFPDFQLALFMRSPGSYLASRVLSMGPDATKEMIATLTGRAQHNDRKIDLGTGNVKTKTDWQEYDESVLPRIPLTELKINKAKLAALFNSSDFLKSLRKNAFTARERSLENMMSVAQNINDSETFDTLSSTVGGRIKTDTSSDVPSDQMAVVLKMTKAAILMKIIDMLRKDPQMINGGPEIKALYDKYIKKISSMR